jgi:hypothetical protein
MEALGTMAGCIAHDCKDLIPAIWVGDLIILNPDKQASDFPGVRPVRSSCTCIGLGPPCRHFKPNGVETNIRFYNPKLEVKKEAPEDYERDRSRNSSAIMDLNMRALDGTPHLEKLRKMDPGLKILTARGFAIDAKTTRFLNEHYVGFLREVFKVREFLKASQLGL